MLQDHLPLFFESCCLRYICEPGLNSMGTEIAKRSTGNIAYRIGRRSGTIITGCAGIKAIPVLIYIR